MAVCSRGLARCFLVLINALAVLFAILLVYLGCTGCGPPCSPGADRMLTRSNAEILAGFLSTGAEAYGIVINPFAVVIAVGACVLLTSLFGLFGAMR